jgi:hypothetical protein
MIEKKCLKVVKILFIVCFIYTNISAQTVIISPKKQINYKVWDKAIKNSTNNNLYLLGGMNFSKQNISLGDYSSNFNYNLNAYNNNVYKTGFFGGLRLDAIYNHKHSYSLEMVLNKFSTGTFYKDGGGSLSPFIGNFSKFKADDQFFTLNTALHYKKLILLGDTLKRKFYLVAGPSLETRISGQSTDNLVNNNYNRFVLRGDIGLEFDNHSYYTLFIHYKQGITSFTQSPIHTTLNSVELGMMIKVSDLF